MGRCPPLWTGVHRYGLVSTIMDRCPPFWLGIHHYEQVLTIMDRCPPLWTGDPCPVRHVSLYTCLTGVTVSIHSVSSRDLLSLSGNYSVVRLSRFITALVDEFLSQYKLHHLLMAESIVLFTRVFQPIYTLVNHQKLLCHENA